MNSVTPVFDYQEPPISAKPATNTAANVLAKPAVSKQAPPPPEFKSGQTTLPGSNPKTENLTPEGIKSAVGEIVQNLDRDNAWATAKNDSPENSSSNLQEPFKELTDMDNRINEHWVSFTGAKVPSYADLEKHFTTA